MPAFVQSMMQNSGAMQGLLTSPMTQQLLSNMANDSNLAQQLLSSNPLFANNPGMQESLRNMAPTLMNQLRDPNFQQVLSNPAALQAIMQIQQGIENLRVAAPNFANRYLMFTYRYNNNTSKRQVTNIILLYIALDLDLWPNIRCCFLVYIRILRDL